MLNCSESIPTGKGRGQVMTQEGAGVIGYSTSSPVFQLEGTIKSSLSVCCHLYLMLAHKICEEPPVSAILVTVVLRGVGLVVATVKSIGVAACNASHG